ncbi:MAG: 2-amino-4-hydroxy-6-hydroxymethyldihydropteridine diphosphokinase, partial [Bdellovibrionales bacterium]|nr:2-amino-4-hydroxy-6-hydroxymethyldihydropteridine diphosphokinase [Bdellovibrionales bacterium]
MKVFLGIGSNLSPRKQTIRKALKELSLIGSLEKVSPLYETPALLPPEAPPDWNNPFLNLAVQMEFSEEPLVL